MNRPLRQSTASQKFYFLMIDNSDFKTRKTGLTIANTDIKLIFEGGTTQTSKNSGGATEIGSTGVYYCTFDATDSATLGALRIDISVAGALPYFRDTAVINTALWDSLYASSGGAIPNVGTGNAGALLIDGTGTAAVSNSGGKVLLQATQSGVTIPTVTTVTNQLTAAAIATGVWTDTTASDFTTSLSIGKSIMNGVSLGTGLTVNSLTNLPSIPNNWITAAGIADGAIDRATFAADTGLQTPRSNTAQAGGNTSITLDASASATDNFYRGDAVSITGGTGAGQDRIITAYVGSTKVATVTPAWATNPDNTSTFAILPRGSVNVTAWNFQAVPATNATGVPKVEVYYWAGANIAASGANNYPLVGIGDFEAAQLTQITTAASAATPAVTVSDKTGFALTSAYDAAKTAAQAGNAMTLTSGERDSIAAALLDLANGVETSLTLRQALKLIAAISAGQVSGGGTSTVIIKAANNAGTTRITATCDSAGNRSSLTLNI